MDAPDRVVPVNGVELAVDDRGEARDGSLPLVLVHGFTGGRVDFADVIDELARDRRVVAWEHRGHADSTNTGDPATYTFDQLADDLHAGLDELGVERLHLLGHSMGGVVAQRYALAHPERVQSLALMDTAGEAMHGAIPGSTLVVIPDAGHSPQDENPAAWLAALHAHLARA